MHITPNTKTGPEVPVGAIVAYAAPDTTKLPSNWHNCDGSAHARTDYPDLFNVLGTCNGGNTQTFELPHLQGQFLRGSSPSDVPVINAPAGEGLTAGTRYPAKTANDPTNPITLQFDIMPNNMEDTCSEYYQDGSVSMMRWSNSSASYPISSTSNETRPCNMYLYYIIKMTAVPASASTSDPVGAANIPVGAIIPFVGQDDIQAGSFPDWIKCNGTPVQANQVGTLGSVLGQRFSRPNTDGTLFVPPDLTGLFIRGIDLDGSVDPNWSHRTAAPDTKSQGTGSTQLSDTSPLNVHVDLPYYSTRSDDYSHDGGNKHIANGWYSKNWPADGGAQETRPNNAAVSYYINSQSTTAKQEIPVGGVIAITEPSASTTLMNVSYWHLCDGSNDVTSPDWSTLVDKSDNGIWGPGSNNQDVKVPDFRAQFLRGANPANNVTPNDPNPKARTSYSGTSATGTGSYQKFATVQPQKLGMPSDFQYSTGEYSNLTDTVPPCDNLPQYSSNVKVTVEFPDSETAPMCVAVNFYVRIA